MVWCGLHVNHLSTSLIVLNLLLPHLIQSQGRSMGMGSTCDLLCEDYSATWSCELRVQKQEYTTALFFVDNEENNTSLLPSVCVQEQTKASTHALVMLSQREWLTISVTEVHALSIFVFLPVGLECLDKLLLGAILTSQLYQLID